MPPTPYYVGRVEKDHKGVLHSELHRERTQDLNIRISRKPAD